MPADPDPVTLVLRGDGLTLVPVRADEVEAALAGRFDELAAASGALVAGAGWPHADTPAAFGRLIAGGWTWLVVDGGRVVGELGTKGPPDAAGTVEIGYGLAAASRGRGIGGRAVAVLLEALDRRGDVRLIRAHVAPHNVASVRLLHRLGFRQAGNAADEVVYERPATPLGKSRPTR